MIKNERQYRITKAQADRFQDVLSQMVAKEADPTVHPLLFKAQQDAVRSQLDDLRRELAEYDALRSGERSVLAVEDFNELPRALIKARIAANLSQKQLADRLGLKEQQVQQYESTEYAGASFTRVLEVIQALGILVREDVFLPSAQVSKKRLFQRLQEMGVDRQFAMKRLLPRPLAAWLEADTKEADVLGSAALQAAAQIGRVYNVSPSAMFGNGPLDLSASAVDFARFKMPARVEERKTNAYTVYAHYLSLLLLEATAHLERKPVPTNAKAIRADIVRQYGDVTFESAIRYVWGLGIPVLPLNDPGGFHGACWRVERRNVIVLKQGAHSLARWLFDLIHELSHAGESPEAENLAVIEADETSAERRNSQAEQDASRLAGEVVLDGRAEELAGKCVRAAGGKIPLLKAAVGRVASREHVPSGALANYLAWRLSMQGEDWWSTANALQEVGGDPWRIARDCCSEHIRLEKLNDADRSLLLQALAD